MADTTNKYGFFKKNGVTAKTPKNIQLGAGTIYKNLKFENGSWKGSILGATSGGNTYNITNEQRDLGSDIDGVHVKVKGLIAKQGETATLEVNLIELSQEIIEKALIAKEDTSTQVDGFKVIKTKAEITDEDYLDNIGFVGFTAEGKPTIIIMDNAICTSGLSNNPKDKDPTVSKVTFECTAELNDDGNDYDVLPVAIYMPTEN